MTCVREAVREVSAAVFTEKLKADYNKVTCLSQEFSGLNQGRERPSCLLTQLGFFLELAATPCYNLCMSTAPTLEEQIATAGLAYGRRHDISYRAGLILQSLGAAVVAVLYPLENPFYTAGIMIFEAGVLASAIYLLVWMTWVKKVILGSVVTGIALQALGFCAPEQHAGTVIIAGIGLVCAGSAGMAGKEAYCFGYREGWMLMRLGFPVMVLANLIGKENRIFNSLGFSVLFLLLLSLTGKKLKQRLLSPCTRNVCGAP
jgi:uncharacterized integral membrane protein